MPLPGKVGAETWSLSTMERCHSVNLISIVTLILSTSLISRGISCKVYEGFDWGNHMVTMERVNEIPQEQLGQQDGVEIKIQSQICQGHVVSLIGFCDEGNERFRVYDYMANRSLQDHV
ncbi:hypothetical protein Acr_02g0008060 [Actinidia rufa]|uniref:Uncharacterized protein n=1 Tax=Actinidia rufa TaxID=165716 RepID=A0A7J0E8T4_9ERIC|nr:hypothetical protein Acr_02g0008060 [Actinidia rufa]